MYGYLHHIDSGFLQGMDMLKIPLAQREKIWYKESTYCYHFCESENNYENCSYI